MRIVTVVDKTIYIGLVFLVISVYFLQIVPAVCIVPIDQQIIIDNVEDFSEYVFIAHFSDGHRRYQRYEYLILNSSSKKIPHVVEGKTYYLEDVYVVKESEFTGVNQTTIVTPLDSCGNIIKNNIPNNSCGVPDYTIGGGASYSYPYNFEIEDKFRSLGISRQIVGSRQCADREAPHFREDYFEISLNRDGNVMAELEKAVYYYGNNITKEAYPDEDGEIELIKLQDDEVGVDGKERISLFEKIINWFKKLLGPY